MRNYIMFSGDLSLNEVIRNRYQLQFEQLATLIEQEEDQTLTTLLPLTEEEQRLGRYTEVLGLQRKIVQQAQEQAPLSPEKLIRLNHLYQTELSALTQDMVSNYQNYLKERMSDEANRFRLLKQFQETLQGELEKYQAFQVILKDERALTTQLRSLNDIINAHIDQLEMFNLQRTAIVELSQERRAFLGDHQRKIAVAQQTSTNDPHFAFLTACIQGNLEEVKHSVEMQKKSHRAFFINRLGIDGRGGLHQACGRGHYVIVKYLLGQQGVKPLLRDEEGYTAFHYTAVKPYPCTTTILEVLYMAAGNSLDIAGPYGRTALHTAALFGNLPAVQWLVRHNAKINVAEQGGGQRTPLHNAAFKGHGEIVQYLLEKGANPLALNAANETALFEALFYGQETVAQVFRERHFWLTPTEQKQLQVQLEDRPTTRQCLLRLLQPEMELHAVASALESTYRSAAHTQSTMPIAAHLGTSMAHVWTDSTFSVSTAQNINNNQLTTSLAPEVEPLRSTSPS
jgi:ankyrin repeat protein